MTKFWITYLLSNVFLTAILSCCCCRFVIVDGKGEILRQSMPPAWTSDKAEEYAKFIGFLSYNARHLVRDISPQVHSHLLSSSLISFTPISSYLITQCRRLYPPRYYCEPDCLNISIAAFKTLFLFTKSWSEINALKYWSTVLVKLTLITIIHAYIVLFQDDLQYMRIRAQKHEILVAPGISS